MTLYFELMHPDPRRAVGFVPERHHHHRNIARDPLKGIPSNAFDEDHFTEKNVSLPLGPLPTEYLPHMHHANYQCY